MFEPSSQDSFPALEPIPSIIPPGDGRIPTAKPFSPTDARLTYRCIWTAKNDDRFDPEAEVDERCLPMSIYELTG